MTWFFSPGRDCPCKDPMPYPFGHRVNDERKELQNGTFDGKPDVAAWNAQRITTLGAFVPAIIGIGADSETLLALRVTASRRSRTGK